MSEGKIVVEVGLVPMGLMEGAPCLRITASGEVDRTQLMTAMLGKWRPGTNTIWVDEAPWGEASWDIAIATAMMADRFRQAAFVVRRTITELRWSALNLHWIGDVTPLFADPLTDADVMDVIMRLEYRPALAEIVVVKPSIENVRPSLLDAVYEELNPENTGMLYTNPANAGEGVRATTTATRCHTPWMVRELR